MNLHKAANGQIIVSYTDYSFVVNEEPTAYFFGSDNERKAINHCKSLHGEEKARKRKSKNEQFRATPTITERYVSSEYTAVQVLVPSGFTEIRVYSGYYVCNKPDPDRLIAEFKDWALAKEYVDKFSNTPVKREEIRPDIWDPIIVGRPVKGKYPLLGDTRQLDAAIPHSFVSCTIAGGGGETLLVKKENIIRE